MVQIKRRNKSTGLFWWWSENDQYMYTERRPADRDHGSLLSMLMGRDWDEERQRQQRIDGGRRHVRPAMETNRRLFGKVKID